MKNCLKVNRNNKRMLINGKYTISSNIWRDVQNDEIKIMYHEFLFLYFTNGNKCWIRYKTFNIHTHISRFIYFDILIHLVSIFFFSFYFSFFLNLFWLATMIFKKFDIHVNICLPLEFVNIFFFIFQTS